MVDAGEEGGAALHLDGDTFQGNVGHGSGSSGAVQLTTYHDSTVSLEATGSTFTQNSAPDAGLGGALDAYNSDDDYSPLAVSLTRDHFTDNSVGSAATDEEGVAELKQQGLEVLEDGNIGGLNGVLVAAAAEAGVRTMCERLLANPVTEDFEIAGVTKE